MKRANQPTTTVCRIVATLHPAGISKKTKKKYDSFVSFKIHDGKTVTDFKFLNTEKTDNPNYNEFIEMIDAGATTFDMPCGKLYRFEKDENHAYPMVVGGLVDWVNVICYDAPEELPL